MNKAKPNYINPPKYLLPWLTYTKMLSAKLRSITNDINLKVLKHNFVRCSWWDKYVLGITRPLLKLAVTSELQEESMHKTEVYTEVQDYSTTESLDKLGYRKGLGNRYFAGASQEISIVLCREILISAWGDYCWYARTIIPKTTYMNHQALFVKLNTQTLGDLIFADNGIRRNYLKYYAIDSGNIEYHWLDKNLIADKKVLWARLSEFILEKDRFFLFEVFLPGLENYIC